MARVLPDMTPLLRDLDAAARARLRRFAGLPVRPRLVTFNVTDRCNAHCAMCNIHQRKPVGRELELHEIRALFADPVFARLDVLRVTGGEPFLRRDIADIVRAAAGHTPCRIVYVTTNGTFPDRVAEFVDAVLPSRATLHIQVSLDALDDRHDAMRGLPGAREKAMATLEILARTAASQDFHFGINQTVVADTLDQIAPVADLAQKLGSGHSIILGAKHHEGKDMTRALSSGRPLGFETESPMRQAQIREFYSEVEKAKYAAEHNKPKHSSALLRELSEAYLNAGGQNRLLEKRHEPAPPCMAMFAHFRLLPHGDVVACSVLSDRPAGNVRDTAPGKIWRSGGADRVRRAVLRCPGCWIECDINPSIFYSGDIVAWAAARWVSDPDFRTAFPPDKIMKTGGVIGL